MTEKSHRKDITETSHWSFLWKILETEDCDGSNFTLHYVIFFFLFNTLLAPMWGLELMTLRIKSPCSSN